jgi:hypothetical protein
MSAFPEFRRAVLQWRMVATRRLRQNTSDWTRISGLPVWTHNSDGGYRIERDPLVWNYESIHQLTMLPQWSRIEEVVSSNSGLQVQFGHAVGSAYARGELDLESTLRYLLPKPVWSDDRSEVLLDNSGFENEYRALESFLSGDTVTQVTMWLVRGVELDKPIRLDDRTVLRKLNPFEVIDCLALGLITPRFGILLPSDPFEGVPVGLFLSRTEPKVIDAVDMAVDLEDFNSRILAKQKVVENLQSCAAVANLPNLSVSSMRVESHSWEGRLSAFMAGGGASIKFSLVNRLRFDAITSSTARLLKKTWGWLSRPGASSNLGFAARRLGYANERVRLEDHLLDTMIAAEALYLGGGTEGELRFRLSTHAAVWAEPTKLNASRRDVYDFMRIAYDARSRIAHGNEPDPSRLKFKGNVITLEKFCNILNEIVRTGLVRAINFSERNSVGKFNTGWDGMILR